MGRGQFVAQIAESVVRIASPESELGLMGFLRPRRGQGDVERLSQCDYSDGAADGIIEEPSLCKFRPEALICRPSNGRLKHATSLFDFIINSYVVEEVLGTDNWFKYALHIVSDFNTAWIGPEELGYAL